MNGFIILIPFLLIRFTLLSKLNKEAIKRAAHVPAMQGSERVAYWIYQISNVAIIIYLCFLTIKVEYSWIFFIGSILYLLGLILCTVSIIKFASSSSTGFHCSGIYKRSRNPMYVSYFLLFIGCAFLTQSLILGGIVLIFQIFSHWIILAEERWCIETFKDAYKDYMKKVRRYI